MPCSSVDRWGEKEKKKDVMIGALDLCYSQCSHMLIIIFKEMFYLQVH